MFIVIDDRESVTKQYVAGFGEEGARARALPPAGFQSWLRAMPAPDLATLDGFVLGDGLDRTATTATIRALTPAPIIALNESRSLEQTLALFTAGIDDIVRKPVHVREIIARANAIRRRVSRGPALESEPTQAGRLVVYADGRDPEIDGESLILPRRERHILEYLAKNRGRQVTKSQIFNAVYGDHESACEESVVEGHISKLRKKLRARLGHDPIEAKRMAGYTFIG